MRKEPFVLIILGPPCTGKTTLARKLAERFSLPFINKDSIKELLFDSLGWSNREWSKKVGLATYELLYYFVRQMLLARQSFIVESNFKANIDSQKFNELKKQNGFDVLQIVCSTDGRVLLERFRMRSESGERHPGHVDSKNYDEFEESLLKGKYDPLEINGPIINIDTTDFSVIDYENLFEKIDNIYGQA